MDYEKLTKEYATPLYIYDIDKLKERIAYLKRYLGNKIRLVYAVKANTFIVPYVHELVDSLELCSFGEYEIAKNAHVPFDKMVISGVNKDEKSIETIFQNGIPGRFTIESLEQWKLLKRLCKEHDKQIKVLLRYTSGNQFGMSKEDIETILNEPLHNIEIKGIQYFSKTQRHSLPILERELIKLSTYMEELETKFGIFFEEFEYGPGFPIYYFEGDDFDEEEFLKGFKDIVDRTIKNCQVNIELGRSIAASCGEYITEIVDLKKNDSAQYAIVDGGINHISYYGQTMAIKIPYHEIVPDRKGDESYIICGSLCTINDILIKDLHAANLQIGDLIVFKNAGAYCATEGISLFLSRDLPRILIRQNEKITQTRDAFKTSTLNG